MMDLENSMMKKQKRRKWRFLLKKVITVVGSSLTRENKLCPTSFQCLTLLQMEGLQEPKKQITLSQHQNHPRMTILSQPLMAKIIFTSRTIISYLQILNPLSKKSSIRHLLSTTTIKKKIKSSLINRF